MKALAAFILVLSSLQLAMAADRDIAPGGTLRAAYLGGNPAQAVRGAGSGARRFVDAVGAGLSAPHAQGRAAAAFCS
jgi:hypothetical protein